MRTPCNQNLKSHRFWRMALRICPEDRSSLPASILRHNGTIGMWPNETRAGSLPRSKFPFPRFGTGYSRAMQRGKPYP